MAVTKGVLESVRIAKLEVAHKWLDGRDAAAFTGVVLPNCVD